MIEGMTAFTRASELLDEVQHLAQLERFDPGPFLSAVGASTEPPGATLAALAAQLDGLRDVLGEIDRFAGKSMRIRMLHEEILPAQLRTLLHSTLLAYERDLPLLRQRVAGSLARVAPDQVAAVTERVLATAEQVLAVRAALRHGVLEQARAVAAAWLPVAARAARDRSQPDGERDRWKRARVDLEQLAARGEVLDGGSFGERLERLPAPEEPPDDEAERPDRFSLLELD